MHAYIYTCIHTYLLIYIHTYIHAYMHACTHTFIHSRIHYIHACKYIPGAAEQLATLKTEGGDVPTISEEREGGVGGTRRVVAQAKTLKSHYAVTLSRKNTRVLTFEKILQADLMHGAFEILPRATRVCEELDCLDTVLKIARCQCVCVRARACVLLRVRACA
jgi:hypothetical protein